MQNSWSLKEISKLSHTKFYFHLKITKSWDTQNIHLNLFITHNSWDPSPNLHYPNWVIRSKVYSLYSKMSLRCWTGVRQRQNHKLYWKARCNEMCCKKLRCINLTYWFQKVHPWRLWNDNQFIVCILPFDLTALWETVPLCSCYCYDTRYKIQDIYYEFSAHIGAYTEACNG